MVQEIRLALNSSVSMRENMTVSFKDRAAIPSDVMVRVLDNEAVLLNLESEKYFGLDQTGTRMWQLVTAAPAIEAAFEQLVEEYDVAPEMLRADLAELLTKLVDHGLLHMVSCDVEAPSQV
jgi:hypothetical protein